MKLRSKSLFIIILSLFIIFTEVFTAVKGLGLVKDVHLRGDKVIVPFPRFSVHTIISGAFQRGFDEWLMKNIGLFGMYIKLDNQINYSLFNFISGSQRVMLGKNRWLYETGYLPSFNKIDTIPVEELEEDIRRISLFQKELSSRGISFILLLSPSKLTVYPEYLDERYIVSGRDARIGNYENVIPLLEKYSINFFDARKFILDLKKKDSKLLFSPTGSHWNFYAARIVADEFIFRLERIMKKKLVNLGVDGVVEAGVPYDADKDLSDMTNLIFSKTFFTRNYYPIVKCRNSNDVCKEMSDNDDLVLVRNHEDCYYYPAVKCTGDTRTFRPRVLAVGGSYCLTIFHYLDICSFYAERDFFFYYGSAHSMNFEYPEKRKTILDKNTVDLKNAILDKDVVIIEANDPAVRKIGFGFIEDALKALKK